MATRPTLDRGSSGLPIPFGWFGVALSSELEIGAIRTLDYFAQQFVMWRGADGQVRALDPYCPHLGAHLGVNSTIQGNDLQCAFHHCSFNGAGQVTDIPYSKVIPPVLKRSCQPNWPVREADGVIYVWYHPNKAEPKCDIARLPDCPDGEWVLAESHEWIVNTHVQEITENGQNYAHFNAVHGIQGPAAGEFQMEGWGRRNKITA